MKSFILLFLLLPAFALAQFSGRVVSFDFCAKANVVVKRKMRKMLRIEMFEKINIEVS